MGFEGVPNLLKYDDSRPRWLSRILNMIFFFLNGDAITRKSKNVTTLEK